MAVAFGDVGLGIGDWGARGRWMSTLYRKGYVCESKICGLVAWNWNIQYPRFEGDESMLTTYLGNLGLVRTVAYGMVSVLRLVSGDSRTCIETVI